MFTQLKSNIKYIQRAGIIFFSKKKINASGAVRVQISPRGKSFGSCGACPWSFSGRSRFVLCCVDALGAEQSSHEELLPLPAGRGQICQRLAAAAVLR